ncbi:hypothetical protein ED733_005322 [Metarhizium rileyi]|uniref:Zn(2)-C6 fungal-type domain-containing protein n=1 Tax=Metarhizium rileyi (strain RCEF 4871) TaxID=1649241 RepID=A0A5C6GHR0_METRR|nr:hypothetical protein ED733_005322 [Metarhizium rileyi]
MSGLESMQQPGQKRPAKLFHKKSRTGCQRCRSRRVKCDEAKPICSNCTRLQLNCVYDRIKPADQPTRFVSVDHPRSLPAGKESLEPENVVDPPESEARRKLELSLFYHYFSETGPSISVDEASHPFWVDMVSQLAFKCNALLYSLLLLSALHRTKKSDYTDKESLHHSSTYLSMTLRELNREIEHLSAGNVDAVCLTASLLRIYTFVRFQDRDLEPYTPPTSWLRMTGTSSAVFRQSAEITSMNPSSVGMQMVDLVTHLLDEEAARLHTKGLIHLMRRQDAHELEEPWDVDVQDAYLSTLNYIGAIWRAMQDRQPPGSVVRRLIVFPLFVDNRFVDMVDEKRPRALVIMAHYFALLAMLRGFWWVGDAGPREVRAIAKQLPLAWQGALVWPLEVLKDQIVFTHDMEVNKLSEYAAGLTLQI